MKFLWSRIPKMIPSFNQNFTRKFFAVYLEEYLNSYMLILLSGYLFVVLLNVNKYLKFDISDFLIGKTVWGNGKGYTSCRSIYIWLLTEALYCSITYMIHVLHNHVIYFMCCSYKNLDEKAFIMQSAIDFRLYRFWIVCSL